MTEERDAMTDGTLGHRASLPGELRLWENLWLGSRGGAGKEWGNRLLREQENGSGSGANRFFRVG